MCARPLLLAMLLAMIFCSGCSSFNFFKVFYEGIQTRDQLRTTPAERAGKPDPMNYQQYESERKR